MSRACREEELGVRLVQREVELVVRKSVTVVPTFIYVESVNIDSDAFTWYWSTLAPQEHGNVSASGGVALTYSRALASPILAASSDSDYFK